MLKKCMTFLLAVCMLVSLMPTSVFATNGAEMASSKPNATVTKLDPITLAADEYMCWPQGDDSVDRPLQIVMNFKANDTLEAAEAGGFGKYVCDFYLTFEGLANGSIVADDCYLAGNYGDFGWIVIPTDDLTLEDGVEYPVVAAYDANLTYEDICGSVKDFTAAIYVAPDILFENPNFKVTLSLKMTNPNDADEVLVVGEPAVYTVADLMETPNATVEVLEPVTLKAGEHTWYDGSLHDGTVDRPLQIVMNFKANETLEEAKAGAFGKFKCDFYLEFEGLANGSIVADGCYLAGNYGTYGWIAIPTDGLQLEANVEYPVVSGYDMNLTYENICDYVKDFTAAIYIAPAILDANPDFKVTLSLKMTDPNNANRVLIVGEPAVYTVEDLSPSIQISDDVIDSICGEGASEEMTENVTKIVTQIQSNTAVQSFAPTNVPTGAELVIALKDMTIESGADAVPTRIAYDVAPMQGDVKVKPDAAIVFRLPVPACVTDGYAKVYHEGELMGTYVIEEENGAKFVRVSSKNFSEFAIEPVDATDIFGRLGCIRNIATKNDNGEDRYQVIFLSGIESLKYKKVGFEVTVNGETRTIETTTVYTGYTAAGVKYTPADFWCDGGYIFGQAINFRVELADASVTVRPFAESFDGQILYGESKSMNGIYQNNHE